MTHLISNIRLSAFLTALFPLTFFTLFLTDFNLFPYKNTSPETAILINQITELLLFPVFAYKMALIFKANWKGIKLNNIIRREKEESQNLYQAIFKSAQNSIMIFDLKKLQPINANPNAFKLFQFNDSECDTINIRDFLPEQQPNGQDSYHQLLKIVNRLIERGYAHYEFTFKNASGQVFHTELNSTRLPDPNGNKAVIFLKDITERKKSHDLLRSSEELFRSLYEESPLGIVMETGEDRRLIRFNSTFSKMLGYTDEEMKQLTVDEITHPDDQQLHIDHFNLLEMGAIKAFNVEKRYFKKDGTILYGNVYVSSITNELGEYRDIAMIEDITLKKQSELLLQQKIKELNDKNEELQRYAQSNTELENFAYVASHDLREPLRTITGFSQLISRKYETLLDQDGKEYLNFIITATAYMESLVNDLLTYSRVNTQNYVEEEINLKDLLEVVTFSLHQSIKDADGKILFENIPDIIYGDRSRLKQLFQNLIANAIKFKKPDVAPEIRVSCEEKKNHWQFRVSDNGIGIQEEYHEKIFQLFRKLHRKDEYEGSGIGLALCKKVVTQHGGTIWVQSTPGECTCFFFTIPKGKIKEVKITTKETVAV
jgi:PAS domain S-box-containing protein